jgi:hypothetical protein
LVNLLQQAGLQEPEADRQVQQAVQSVVLEGLLLTAILGANKAGNMDEGRKLLEAGATLHTCQVCFLTFFRLFCLSSSDARRL